MKEVEVAPTSALEADAANRVSSREVLEILDDNLFDPLAGANVVNFSRSREIEAIAQDTIKVRLSHYSVSSCLSHNLHGADKHRGVISMA